MEDFYHSFNGNIANGTVGSSLRVHHLTFRVSNAKQAATWYCFHFGFHPIAYRHSILDGKETVVHVIKLNKNIFAFRSSLSSDDTEFGQLLAQHGDAVEDVAFEVDSIKEVIKEVVGRGGRVLSPISELTDQHGAVSMATVHALGNVSHTLICKNGYEGDFLPGFESSPLSGVSKRLEKSLPDIKELLQIDHIALNDYRVQPLADCKIYSKNVRMFEECSRDIRDRVFYFRYHQVLHMRRFWSTRDSDKAVPGLVADALANEDETFYMFVGKPGEQAINGQVQQFLKYNGGPGVQHVAFCTNDIVAAVKRLRERGVDFLQIPVTYYDSLRQRLQSTSLVIKESLDELQEHHILLDFDETGYLLQIFTKPVCDRKTLFLEIIQRWNHKGFGAGNIRALMKAIEENKN